MSTGEGSVAVSRRGIIGARLGGPYPLQDGEYAEEARWTAKIGLIIPSGQTLTEPLFNRIAPPDIAFYTSRMLMAGSSAADLRAMDQYFGKSVDELATADVDCLMKCCTVGGALSGDGGEAKECEEAERRTGIPTSTTMIGAVESMRELGISRLVVATPYAQELDQAEEVFLERAGFRVVRMAGLGIADGRKYADVTPAQIFDFAMKSWNPSADGMFLSCMNWQALLVADRLESVIGRPVVTSHSATLWKALELAKAKISIEGCGRLLTQGLNL